MATSSDHPYSSSLAEAVSAAGRAHYTSKCSMKNKGQPSSTSSVDAMFCLFADREREVGVFFAVLPVALIS